MKRTASLAAAALVGAALALTAAPAIAAAGWTIETRLDTAGLSFGKPQTPNAFRLDCSGGKTSLSTWTTRLPRNISEGEFPSRLSVFQGNREIVMGGTGRVLEGGGTRVDVLIADRDAFLTGMGQNRRLVVVSFAGRGTAPAPTATQLADFAKVCANR
ncbi:MAG: hypothetical protein ACRC1J_09265 [Sandaracinobacteroides sp.]